MYLSDTLIGEVIQPGASTDPMCLSAACVCGRGKIRSNNEDKIKNNVINIIEISFLLR